MKAYTYHISQYNRNKTCPEMRWKYNVNEFCAGFAGYILLYLNKMRRLEIYT